MDVASLIVGALLGGVPSWYISKHYSKKSSKELEDKIKSLTRELGGKSTLINFERALSASSWSKRFKGHTEYYVCDNNTNFQIHICDDGRDFVEKWTKVFPDQNTSLFHVDLLIDGSVVQSLPFISADGGRYSIPLPKLQIINEEPDYCWEQQSIDYKVAEVIGNFYRYRTLKEVASFLRIGLV